MATDCIQFIRSSLIWLSTLQEFIIMRVIKHSGTTFKVGAKYAVTLSVRNLKERADNRETWAYMK
jgi:hypothetical protein